jgi:serine/threonine protein kinase
VTVPPPFLVHLFVVCVRVWSILRLCGYPPFFEDDDQEALFAQIRTGAYEFTSPYWDCVSEDGNVTVNVFSWCARLGSSTVMCTFNESTEIRVVCGCLPTRLLTNCAPRRTPPLAAAKDLIARMMELDPARRLSADAVLSHSWMVRRASLCCAPLRVGVHPLSPCNGVVIPWEGPTVR